MWKAGSTSASLVLLGATILLCAASWGVEAADYRLAAGDKIDITAIGVPDLKQRLTIGVDGQISISLIGVVKAEGLTIRELQEQVQQSFSRATFRLKLPGTNEYTALDLQEVSVSIAEYRPVFVAGDVGKPGSQPFTPGLTYRQALSMAGGCDLARFGIQNPILLSADIRGDYQQAWLEFASESVRLRRLEAELDGKGEAIFDGGETPVSPTLMKDMLRTANEKLHVRVAERDAQKAHFDRQGAILGERASTLERQRQSEEQGLRLDEQEASRIASQAERGISAVNRVAEARRISLISATRALQIGVAAAVARREQEQNDRDLAALLAKHREELLTELEDARRKVQAVRVRLQVAADKLYYAGLARVQMSRGAPDPELTFVRKSGSGSVEPTPAPIDGEMMPGDVLQVRCPQGSDPLKAY